MMNKEVFMDYALPVIIALLTAAAGFIGTRLKGVYEKYVNDRTKEAVVRTCVKAAEQLYHDLSGPEKLAAAQAGIVDMLHEKGIPISELEMNMLIESVVSEFNYGFAKGGGDTSSTASGPPSPQGEGWAGETSLASPAAAGEVVPQDRRGTPVYTEEGGSL